MLADNSWTGKSELESRELAFGKASKGSTTWHRPRVLKGFGIPLAWET
jgi:hypothetical protein